MEAHGHFDIWRDNTVILARLKGQWNSEMAQTYANDFKALAEPLLNQDWAHIVYLDDWELGTPEFEAVILELVQWVIEHGLKRTAQVYSPSMLKQFQMDRMVKETQGDFVRQVFANEQQAFAWLEAEGYPVENAQLTLVD
ncbi:MAG: hypothetical protein HWE18_06515 [Gammaproteobacteria bacterium]|nr:hypothetical protein [Gammaproteobacteria bacterium]